MGDAPPRPDKDEKINKEDIMTAFTHLFTPARIGDLELKNRIVMLPLTTGFTEGDETIGERLISFYEARARGGAAMIIVPFAPVPSGSPIEPGIYDDRFLPGARRLAGRIQEAGAKIGAQLITSYHVTLAAGVPEVVGPSPVMNQMLRVVPRELTVAEIRHLVGEYAKAAERLKGAGFDLVEILVGGGYLLNRFLSPITNKRTDAYGGDLRNRMRIILEILEAMRAAVGPGFPLGVRINLEEQMEGGHTIEDSREVLLLLEEAGVQVINAYTGWHESPVPTVQAFLPKGAFADLAQKAKGWVKIPVIAANRINDPFVAEEILAAGKADFVGMARALLADPELPDKAREGRAQEIVPCLACSNCLADILSSYRTWGRPAWTSCAVNPAAGREHEGGLAAAPAPKRVLVVGGGPAGLEAARVAALRGHRVVVMEREGVLGGKLVVGSLPPHKEEIANLVRSLALRARRAGAEIVAGTEADGETVAAQKPDCLVVAVGAVPVVPPFPGVGGANVFLAEEVLAGRKTPRGSVVVVGGGMVGCETAEYILVKIGGVKEITVLEMLDRMAADVSPTYRPFFLARLKRQGIRMVTGAKVTGITPEAVEAELGGERRSFAADTVVLAVGYRPDRAAVERFLGLVPETYVIGDCASPRKIKEAMEEGFLTGRKI